MFFYKSSETLSANQQLSPNFRPNKWTRERKDENKVHVSMGTNPWSVNRNRRTIENIVGREYMREGSDDVIKVLGNHLNEEEVVNVKRRVEDSQGFLRGYMLMEDLTSSYKRPSVLDLKMGTQVSRTSGCTPEKKRKHLELTNSCSTGPIKARLAGMQVYNHQSGRYDCLDKYYGRGLDKTGFVQVIRQFVNKQVIPSIVEQLEEISCVLCKLPTYRLFASSLLIIYEGHSIDGGEAKVRLIDFAQSTFDGFDEGKIPLVGTDHDLIEGVTNLIKVFKGIFAEL